MAHSERNLVFELEDNLHLEETKSLWVFGYGSLCWNPGFPFGKAVTGYIRGYSRKFWQGNTTHRGTEDKVRLHQLCFVQQLLLTR